MGLIYKPLADIRTDLPPEQEYELRHPPSVLRPLRPGDLETLISDADRAAINQEQQGEEEDVSSGLMQRTFDFAFRKPSVSARTARKQMLREIGRLTNSQRISNRPVTFDNINSLEEASENKDLPSASASVGNRDPRHDPDVGVISRSRWEASRTQKRYGCQFDAIRILVLLPGTTRDPVRCTTEIAYIRHREENFESVGKNPLGEDPNYEALSYCWGDLNDKKAIEVDGDAVQVTRNLEEALLHLRRATVPKRLWVDALCIDQSNAEEKNIQVGRMFQVYEQASCVLVWLGPSYENSDLAFYALKSLGVVDGDMEVEDLYEGNHGDREKLWIKPLDPSKLRNAGTLTSEEKTAIKDLFCSRTWWTRRWIIQEIAYASRAYIICGSLMLDWDVLSNIFTFNDSIVDTFEDCRWLQNPFLLHQQRKEAQSPWIEAGYRRRGTTLRSLMARLQGFICSEAKDWIYCIIGLPNFPPRRIYADYTKSIQEAFTEATRVMIYNYDNEGDCQNPSLNVVCSAYRDYPSKYNLPSWVPDWSIPYDDWLFDISENNSQLYQCSGKIPFVSDISFPEKDELGCEGFILGEVIYVSRDQPWNHYELDSYDDKIIATLHQWVTVLKDNFPNRELAARPTKQTFDEWLPTIVQRKVQTWQDLLLEWLSYMRTAEDEDTVRIPEAIIDHLPKASFLRRWQLAITCQGLFGLVPQPASEHDLLAVLYGADVPVILRRLELDSDSHYSLIGPACIQGIMHGMVLDVLGQSYVRPRQIILV